MEKRWQFYHCPICNHSTATITYDKIVDTYRSEEYARHLVASNGSFTEVKRQWTTNVGILKRHCPVGSKALEVGCLDGSGVSALMDAGFDAYGFDVAESSRLECVRNGIERDRIHIADSLLDVEFGQRFNLITIREVIEHVPDVSDLLLTAYQLLEPGGFVMVQTPRFSDVRKEWSCPQHLRVYSTTSLAYVLRLAGFEVQSALEWDGGVCLLCKRIESLIVKPDPYSTHQKLLVRGLLKTSGDVLELGCGNYSTPVTSEICEHQGRGLTSLDNHPAWVIQFGAKTVRWDQFFPASSYGLTLVDHADPPHHQRWKQILKLLPWCDTFVVHDADDRLYGYHELRNMFDVVQDTTTPLTELWTRKHNPSEIEGLKAVVVISTYSENDCPEGRADLLATVTSCQDTSNCEIMVVDDGSCESYREWLRTINGVTLIQGDVNRGIAWSKNVALSMFDSHTDIDAVFLVDDDVIFEASDWQASYTHGLTYLPLLSHSPEQLRKDGAVIGELIKDTLCWGCFVAVSRKCYETIGKYSTEFPAAYGWEHIEYYYRAAIAGLVPAVGFYDIAGNERLLKLSHEEISQTKQQMVRQNQESDVWKRTEAAYKSLSGVQQ
jgi:2-polyprenyl-3-methyl-5-hydroxy-6-metoxy-1,4-benzoquinol methylase